MTISQPRDCKGRFSQHRRDEDSITLGAAVERPRTERESAAHRAGSPRKELPVTAPNPLFEIDDSAFVLPDATYAALRAAMRTATPERIQVLEAIQYAWLGARTGGVGSVLDDRSAFAGLFKQTIGFLTPDGDLLTFKTRDARDVAARYGRIYGLPVVQRGQVWVVQMAEWGAAK